METFSRETPLLDPWYVTGFSEGEATFTYSRSGKQLALYYAIKLTARDRSILEAISAFFGGAGSIYQVRPRAALTPRRGFTKTASYFRVSRRDELGRVVAHFDQYPLRGTKLASYEIWRKMVALKQSFRSPPRDQLDTLARALSSVSPRNGDRE